MAYNRWACNNIVAAAIEANIAMVVTIVTTEFLARRHHGYVARDSSLHVVRHAAGSRQESPMLLPSRQVKEGSTLPFVEGEIWSSSEWCRCCQYVVLIVGGQVLTIKRLDLKLLQR